jgi:NADPH:quinone reductase
VVRAGGRFVSTLLGSPDQLPDEGVTLVPVAANPAPATLDRRARHQAEGTTRVVLQQIYSLDATPGALTDFAAGSLGKLLISTQ